MAAFPAHGEVVNERRSAMKVQLTGCSGTKWVVHLEVSLALGVARSRRTRVAGLLEPFTVEVCGGQYLHNFVEDPTLEGTLW